MWHMQRPDPPRAEVNLTDEHMPNLLTVICATSLKSSISKFHLKIQCDPEYCPLKLWA